MRLIEVKDESGRCGRRGEDERTVRYQHRYLSTHLPSLSLRRQTQTRSILSPQTDDRLELFSFRWTRSAPVALVERRRRHTEDDCVTLEIMVEGFIQSQSRRRGEEWEGHPGS